jgi:hypothetical protein
MVIRGLSRGVRISLNRAKKGGAMITSRLLLAFLFVFIAFPTPGRAQTDPAVGRWKLNLAKSKYASGPVPTNLTVVIEAAGQGVRVTARSVGGNGKVIETHYTAYVDGNDYPVTGSPDYDTVSLKRNGLIVDGTRKKSGKVVQTYQRVVSEDRKTMTVATTGVNALGQKLSSFAVFDRQ